VAGASCRSPRSLHGASRMSPTLWRTRPPITSVQSSSASLSRPNRLKIHLLNTIESRRGRFPTIAGRSRRQAAAAPRPTRPRWLQPELGCGGGGVPRRGPAEFGQARVVGVPDPNRAAARNTWPAARLIPDHPCGRCSGSGRATACGARGVRFGLLLLRPPGLQHRQGRVENPVDEHLEVLGTPTLFI
jgi:hypothetical protein